MNKKYIITIIITFLLTSFLVESRHFFEQEEVKESIYSGQETRWIKSLSPEDIESLETGSGIAFGGMAKLAELNGYPGPRHVLEMAVEIDLSNEQKEKVEMMFSEMQSEAIPLGEKIIGIEKEIDTMFAEKTITTEILENKLRESAELYGQLRFIHLKYHFQTIDILSAEQVQLYNELRGYTADGNPCDNMPEGHDAEMWKKHNNC